MPVPAPLSPPLSPRWRPLAPALAAALLPSCGDDGLFRVDLDGEDTLVVEQGTVLEALAGELGFGAFLAMNLTEDQRLRNQGVEPGDISSARLLSFTLEATAPAGADLAFLQDVRLIVESPGLAAVEVARAADFPPGVARVDFELEDVDLTDYLVSESLTLRAEVEGGRPPEDTTLTAAYALEVGVTLQGAAGACGGG
jgi:hypothetical protein